MSIDQLLDQSREAVLTTNEPEVIPPYLAYVGINQAARLVSKGKTQIYNDIKAGKLSWHIENGKKLLRVSDLDRVYTLKFKTDTGTEPKNHNVPPKPVQNTDPETTQKDIDLAVLKADLRAKEEALRRADEEIRDLRQKQDKQLETIQRLTLLLPAPPPSAPLAVTEPERSPEPPQRLPFWKRLFS